MVGQFKFSFVIITGFILFRDPLIPLQFLGISLTFSGMCVCSQVCFQTFLPYSNVRSSGWVGSGKKLVYAVSQIYKNQDFKVKTPPGDFLCQLTLCCHSTAWVSAYASM